MREKRRRMEEPANRCAAEEAASRARREADRISRELEREGSLPSPRSLQPKRKQHGDSVLGPDGRVDYTSAPQVKAPEGMKAVIAIKNNCWDVSFENKD
jgi:hypothetical protein